MLAALIFQFGAPVSVWVGLVVWVVVDRGWQWATEFWALWLAGDVPERADVGLLRWGLESARWGLGWVLLGAAVSVGAAAEFAWDLLVVVGASLRRVIEGNDQLRRGLAGGVVLVLETLANEARVLAVWAQAQVVAWRAWAA